jgi:HEAT repeat protein
MRSASESRHRVDERGGAGREQSLDVSAARAPEIAARAGATTRVTVRAGLLACLLFASAVPARAAAQAGVGASTPARLVRITAAASPGLTRVRIATDGPQAPDFTSAVLAQPTRIVVDLWNVTIAPEFPPPVLPADTGITRVTTTKMGGIVPIGRVVLHLTAAASSIRCQAKPSADDGSIVFALGFSAAETAAPTPAVPAAKQPAAPRADRPTTTALPPTDQAQVGPPAAEPTAPAGDAPPRQRAAAPKRAPRPPAVPAAPARPAPAREPRPALPSIPHSLGIVLATLLGAGLASAGWRWMTARRRAQGRRGWLQSALRSEDREQWTSALRSVGTWSPGEIRRVDDLLLGVAEDSMHPAVEAARDVLHSAFPTGLLVRRIGRGGPAARTRAVRMTGLHQGETATALLLKAAESPHGMVAEAAVEALARHLREDSARPLLQALVMPDARPATREVVARVVQRAGPQSGPALRKALADPDQLVRCAALEALTVARPPGSVQAVVRLLADPAEAIRARAATALGVLGLESDTSDELLRALTDPSPKVQEEAAIALAQLGGGHLEELLLSLDRRACEDLDFSPSARLLETVATQAKEPLPAFARALSCFNRSVAQDLARALERAGRLDGWASQMAGADPDQCQIIADILQAAARAGVAEPAARGVASPAAAVRETCARIVGESATAATTGLLRPLLGHADEPVRAVAAAGLGRAGGLQDTEALLAALSDPSPLVRAAAAGGLGRLLAALRLQAAAAEQLEAAGSVTTALVKAARDPQGPVRRAAAEALGAADPEEATHALLDIALRDADGAVREAAMASLARLAEHQILPILLVEALNSDDAALRARAVEILAHAGDPLVSHLMIDSLQDADPGVRAMAGRGLWDVVSPKQCEPLVPFLNSPDPKVRAGVAGALGKTRSPEWTEPLSAAAVDPDPRVRAAVMNALGRIGPGAAAALGTVLARYDDSDAYVRARAVEATTALSPESESSAEQVLQLAGDPDRDVRRSVARCLVHYAGAGTYGPLLELLADGELNAPALEVLAEADGVVLHQTLSRAQQAPHLGRRVIAALAQVLRDRWTVADLRSELASLDTESRLAGLEGLAILGSGEAIAEMARLLASDPDPRVRLRAARLLSPHLDNLAVFQALRHAAQADPDAVVREAASEIGRDSLFQPATANEGRV